MGFNSYGKNTNCFVYFPIYMAFKIKEVGILIFENCISSVQNFQTTKVLGSIPVVRKLISMLVLIGR